jgi:hypothetical protein
MSSYKKISLNQALELERLNLIKIYLPLGKDTAFHHRGVEWHENYKELAFKYKKIPLGSILDFIGVDYVIDTLILSNPETNSHTWLYLYGQNVGSIREREDMEGKGKWVYILTNNEYPDIVKIGKAVQPQERVRQINGAGVKSEWTLRYACPVTNDYKVENMVHRHFQDRRIDSDQGHSREFFKVPFDDAVKVLEYISKDFYAGEGKFF